MSKKVTLTTFGVIILLGILYISSNSFFSNEKKFIEANLSVAVHYNTINELKKDSDIIVTGQIDSIKEVQENFPPQLGSTFYNLKIDQIIDSSFDEKKFPETIIVRQYGFKKNNKEVIIAESPLMNVKDQVVLFLKKAIDEPFYYIVGEYQGRFDIKDNKVYSLSEVLKNDTKVLVKEGVSLEEFIQEIQRDS